MREASEFVKKRELNYAEDDMCRKPNLKPNKVFLRNTIRSVMSSNTIRMKNGENYRKKKKVNHNYHKRSKHEMEKNETDSKRIGKHKDR